MAVVIGGLGNGVLLNGGSTRVLAAWQLKASRLKSMKDAFKTKSNQIH
jgi:hypothetical protein